MGLAATRSVALLGVRGHLVDVEVHVAQGLPAMVITGLADTALGEARDRVRAALVNSGCPWPSRRITVNLAPADLPKHGSGYDLAIAAGILLASGALPARAVTSLKGLVLLGELTLDGRVRGVRGVLPAVLAARGCGARRVVVAEATGSEARLVPGVEVISVGSLAALLAWAGGGSLEGTVADGGAGAPWGVGCALGTGGTSDRGRPEGALPGTAVSGPTDRSASPMRVDLADVRGQPVGRAALEIAAAGGHHLLLIGPPGAGKTMLAERLPGILPDLERAAALETTAVHSVAGLLEPGAPLVTRPPFQDPHHSASRAAVIGGGTGFPRPGALSLAHHGVLLLDEAPEFKVDVLEALRQPLESGEVVIARAAGTARYPARFQLVLAANPCPCGLAAGADDRCRCSPQARRRYLARLSGPLLDRVDLQVDLPAVSRFDLADGSSSESSAAVAERVAEARRRTASRAARTGAGRFRANAEVPGHLLRQHWPLGSAADPAHELLRRGLLTARGVDRVLRVAWTLADLAGRARPSAKDVRVAAAYRLAGARS